MSLMSASRSTSHTHAATAIANEPTSALQVHPGRIRRRICVEGWSAILMSGAAFAQDAMHEDAMGK